MYPNVWGGGALFAASGLDYKIDFYNQFIGTLMSDRIGVTFHTDPSVDFYISVNPGCYSGLSWEIVASDVFSGTLSNGRDHLECSFAFASASSIIGKCPAGTIRAVFSSGKVLCANSSYDINGHCFHLTIETVDKYDYFIFSYDQSCSRSPLEADAIVAEKKAYFDAMSVPSVKDVRVKKAFLKAASVMKTQVYTPTGRFKQKWTTPDRLPHRALFLWDSVFHSLGNYYVSEELARDTLYSLFDAQRADGFIPHRAYPDSNTNITQPPIIAFGILKLIQRTGKTDWFEPYYDRIASYLEWNIANRMTEEGLFGWLVDNEGEDCNCAESGMDNSTRFDIIAKMDHIDFSSFMLLEYESMIQLSDIYGRENDKEKWTSLYNALKKKIQTVLWDEEDGFFYDRLCSSKKFNKIKSIASYVALFAGACTKEQAEAMIKPLMDKTEFGTPMLCPSLSCSEATFGTDMWRGPVWINYVYITTCGLQRYGFDQEANAIIKNVVYEMIRWYENDGVIYEFYDCNMKSSPRRLVRKVNAVDPGNLIVHFQAIRDYGWSSTLLADIIAENQELF